MEEVFHLRITGGSEPLQENYYDIETLDGALCQWLRSGFNVESILGDESLDVKSLDGKQKVAEADYDDGVHRKFYISRALENVTLYS